MRGVLMSFSVLMGWGNSAAPTVALRKTGRKMRRNFMGWTVRGQLHSKGELGKRGKKSSYAERAKRKLAPNECPPARVSPQCVRPRTFSRLWRATQRGPITRGGV